jgi:hypothetical protein
MADPRAGTRSTVEAALDAWFLHEWWEDWDTVEAQGTTDKVLALLRSLPVEQRMEAMGMERWVMPDAVYEELWPDDREAVQKFPTLYREAR